MLLEGETTIKKESQHRRREWTNTKEKGIRKGGNCSRRRKKGFVTKTEEKTIGARILYDLVRDATGGGSIFKTGPLTKKEKAGVHQV